MSNIRDEYQRALNNHLAFISQVIRAIQTNTTASYEEKIKALQSVEEHVVRAKRAMIFLQNTGSN